MGLLDQVFAATETAMNGSAVIVSENHDRSSINWVRGMSDPGEMIGCGKYQELRRHDGERDDAYQARLAVLLQNLPAEHRARIEAFGRNAANRRADLGTVNGKVAAAFAGKAAWHGLGTVFSGPMTLDQARTAGGLDYGLEKRRASVQINGAWVETDAHVLVRQDSGAIIGQPVGSRYEIISNESALSLAADLLQGAGTTIESAGVLGNGERAWILAHMPTTEIAGEAHDPYLLVVANHANGRQTEIFPCDLRVECSNTTNIAMRTCGQSAYKLRHTRNWKMKEADIAAHLAQLSANYAAFKTESEALARKPMLDPVAYFDGILDATLDATLAGVKLTGASITDGSALTAILERTEADQRFEVERSYERQAKRRANLLQDMIERYESRTCAGAIHGTYYAGVQAATEQAQHSEHVHYKGNARERSESRLNSILDGRALEVQETAFRLAEAAR